MNRVDELSLRALVLAPNGRDAPLSVMLLREMGVHADICVDLGQLSRELRRGSGLAIIADEALQDADSHPLVGFLGAQPPRSDLPIILLTQRGGGPERNPAALRLGELLGNVSFIERPFHPTTLNSMVRAAVRGRRRQYEARSRLEEISEREQQLQIALTAGRLGSWTMERGNMRFQASTTSRRHLGVSASGEFSCEQLRRAAHPDDLQRLSQALPHSLERGADYVIEYRNVRHDGSVHWVDVRARALKNDAGLVVSLVGVSLDITSRKNSDLERLLAELAAQRTALSTLTRTLEQRVAERTGELLAEVAAREKAQEQLLQSQKMESVGQLTGGIAHEFNNLLMAVMGNLETLRKRLPNEPGTRRLIEGAMQGAQRGASLTQRMLAFPRQQDLKTVSADIGALVSGMQELLRRSLGPQIGLNLQIDNELPPAAVDAHQVELAVLNLAINARDAMPGGGVIEIRLDQQDVHGVEQKLLDGEAWLAPGTYVRVQVADTGLGLSMIHGLAVQLGGHLALASEVGVGTVATLWLPMAIEPAAGVAPPPPQSSPVSRSVTILVVDDDPLIATSTVGMLEDFGHVVIEANSGQRALEIIDVRQDIDLMMTDQAMPGVTGMQLAEIVRLKRPRMPVLLATGYTDLPTSKLATLPRLAKPYQQAQLQAEIEKLLVNA